MQQKEETEHKAWQLHAWACIIAALCTAVLNTMAVHLSSNGRVGWATASGALSALPLTWLLIQAIFGTKHVLRRS